METQTYHFFGSTAFNWAVGATREEVLKKLAQDVGTTIIRRQKKSSGSVYCWTCKVNVTQATTYEIDFFMPKGVPTELHQEALIINTKGQTAPYVRKS